MKTRFSLAVVAIVAALLGLFSVAPAQAAADITRSGSCNASANWQINVSVNFDNTSGSPSTGTVDYAVMSSPNFLDTGSINGSSIEAFAPNGQELNLAFPMWVRDTSKPGYVYRTDPQNANVGVRRVVIDPETSTNVECSDFSSAVTIYSAN